MMMGHLKANIPTEYHLTFLVHRQFSVLLQNYLRWGHGVLLKKMIIYHHIKYYTLKIIPCLFSSLGFELRGF